jgi:hypothetical protein
MSPVVRELDQERKRLNMSKAQLAARCGLAGISIRKIFTAEGGRPSGRRGDRVEGEPADDHRYPRLGLPGKKEPRFVPK